MEPGQNNGTDRRERRCLSLQTAFTRHSPTFSSLSFSVLPLSITALHLLGSGCYKTHAERNQMTAALKTFHTNQELCFTPLPSFLTPLSFTHTHTRSHTTNDSSQLLICPAGQRVSHYNSPLYSSVTPQEGTIWSRREGGSRRKGQNTHSQLSGYLRRFNAWLMPKDATTDKQCHGKLERTAQITHTL